ncbi:hypothetical protein MRB53_001722 [Persea americana]|uniref:Uncharacterized protein n=1 Tax=Persea americana TaxID=3435 RepID=A0ACC2MSN2_PERAE|nr:hypothetical protein MRB53_001722 [Persea americana]
MEGSAASMVVEAALSALFQGLFDKLALPSLKKLGLLFGVEREAKKLSSTLSRIQSLLSDAEDRQIKQESVSLWLSDLKEVAYDAEDILDELAFIALRSKLETAPIQTRKRKLTDQVRVPHLFSRFFSNLDLGSRIMEIRKRLDEIESESNQFHLKVIHPGWSERLKPRQRPPTSSIIDESIVFGRETEREKLVGLLTSEDPPAGNGIWVIPIYGMGGLGKTTLAQLVYNDERVVKRFKMIRAWVYVSEDFDLIRLTKAIAESVTGSACHLTNLDAIQVSIQKALSKKRFLVVLDDVWNDNCNDWDALRAPLMVGARGSRILVTTRSQRVSSIMGTVPVHFLQSLSDDDCWSLFKKRAFVEGNSDAYPDLVMIGKEIVNKCKGLPLAVKTLGGLLHYTVDAVEWEAILKSEIWDLPEERNDILPALRLSYHHLPAHLKRCFAYCCVFPKGSKVEGNRLVLMWMAQGFIQSKVSNHMEERGGEYLTDLVSRSLLNCVSTSYYTMHDLTHDLAWSVSGADVLEIGDGKSLRNAEKARYMSDRNTELDNFEDFFCLKSLRTLRLFCTRNIPADLFVHLRHIRILHLCGYQITELPESIGNLLQLRLFYLSWTKIERLPKSVTRLYNLQALMLEYCSQLVELPSDLSNLVSLRYLSLRGCAVSIPPRIGRLTSLQMLEVFNVGKDIGCGINELKDIIHLGGSLRISKLENLVNAQEAKEAELKKKQKVHKLQLEWKSYDVESRQEGIEEEVLKGLQPHTNLKELEIEGYCGVSFPTWLADSLFSNLVSVRLSSCKCHLLPPFGQLPSLKCLNLFGLYGLKKVGREFCGNGPVKGFPSLDSLCFQSMPDLVEWSGLKGDISHVREIDISDCSKLRLMCLSEEVGLQHLTSLHSLKILDCPQLTSLGDKIHSLPEELPTTLQSLHISGCPLLKEKCKDGGFTVSPAPFAHSWSEMVWLKGRINKHGVCMWMALQEGLKMKITFSSTVIMVARSGTLVALKFGISPQENNTLAE